MLDLHGIANVAIELEPDSPLMPEHLEAVEGEFTAFLINLGETSQDVLYDADLIGAYCRERGLF